MQHHSTLDRALADDEVKRWWQMVFAWAFLGCGLCLVAFAPSLGMHWVGLEHGSNFSHSSSAREYVDAAALTIRSVGFLLFAFGLVERILIRFGK